MSNEAPTLSLPPHMSVLISEETTSGWMTVYHGQVSSTGSDMRLLEEVMPLWLLEYLLINKIPVIPTVKISFVLLPWKGTGANEDSLPELLNTFVASSYDYVLILTTKVMAAVSQSPVETYCEQIFASEKVDTACT
jgi:hypothetical protein